MNLEDLNNNPELLEKLKSAETPEDLFAIARESGVELTQDQLDAITGGVLGTMTYCTWLEEKAQEVYENR